MTGNDHVRPLSERFEQALNEADVPASSRAAYRAVLASLADFALVEPSSWRVVDLERFYRLNAASQGRAGRRQVFEHALDLIAQLMVRMRGADVVREELSNDPEYVLGPTDDGRLADRPAFVRALVGQILSPTSEGDGVTAHPFVANQRTGNPGSPPEPSLAVEATTATGTRRPRSAPLGLERPSSLGPDDAVSARAVAEAAIGRSSNDAEKSGRARLDEARSGTNDVERPVTRHDLPSGKSRDPSAPRPLDPGSSAFRRERARTHRQPGQLTIRWSPRGWAEAAWTGFVHGTELRRTLERLVLAISTRDGSGCLLDMRAASVLAEDDAKWFLRWLERCREAGIRHVAVAAPDATLSQLQISRLYRTWNASRSGLADESVEIGLFDTLDEGRHWLLRRVE